MLTRALPLALALTVVACGGGDSENASTSDSSLLPQKPIAGGVAGSTTVDPPPTAYVGDANDPATILADADVFWARYFGASDDEEVASIYASFTLFGMPPYWGYGQETSALVQMYDLVAPLDPVRAERYLRRLG